MKFTKTVAALGLAAAMTSPVSMADPITTWDWALFSGWTEWTGDDVQALNPFDVDPATPGPQTAYDTLAWPDAGGSSLTVENPMLATSGSSYTGGDLGMQFNLTDQGDGTFSDTVDGSLLTHDNQVISATVDNLLTAVLTDWFVLESALGEVGPITSEFDILFEETFNEDTEAECSAGQTSGLSNEPCEDIFVVLNPGDLMFSFSPGDGYIYTLAVTAPQLGPLNADQCAAANAAPGCVGLVTEEDFFNQVQFELTLSARLIPAPAVLGLMGIGLLGLGYSRRRASRKAS